MAIKKFPFTFELIRGGQVTVTQIDDVFNFDFIIVKGSNAIKFNWKPAKEEVSDNRVIKRAGFTDTQYQAIAGFWAIYND